MSCWSFQVLLAVVSENNANVPLFSFGAKGLCWGMKIKKKKKKKKNRQTANQDNYVASREW